jgi:hypothetical protein
MVPHLRFFPLPSRLSCIDCNDAAAGDAPVGTAL